MAEHWKIETDDAGIAWLCLDRSDAPANTLASFVIRELDEILDELSKKPPSGLVMYSGKPGSFIMGADINEFGDFGSTGEVAGLARLGQGVFLKIRRLPCPTVAAVNGVCLGGGLEIAMMFDYRIGPDSDERVFGLPEVKLGLHPGFGGTVNAVRLCGVRQGMPLMLTGSPINAKKALRIGLIDRIAGGDAWRDVAKKLIASKPPLAKAPLVDRIMGLAPFRPLVKNMLTKQVASKARRDHYPSPYAMIDLWAKHGASEKTGYDGEAESFARMMNTDTARNLIRVFFLQGKLKKQGNKIDNPVRHVHVVGAGVMGGDIAAWCALRGHTVTLQDREQKYIDPAIERAARLFGKKVRDDAKRAETAARLEADVEGAGVARADLVIEAIFENLEAKQALYQRLQAEMKPGALLATNTSSIRLEELRTVLDAPTRFIGLHFFNPVALLPLVEVIRCADTEQDAMDIGFAFTKGIGKFPLECMSAPGFVVNRLLAPYMGEAMVMAREGVPLVAIDKAAEKFGMPVGPIELVDTVGLDIAKHVATILAGSDDRDMPETDIDALVEQGRLGRKSGHGYYPWQEGRAVKPQGESGPVPDDIEDRLILPLVNEAVACLEEGVVASDDLLDAGVIFGTGFAPFRGGPVNYARERGVETVVSALRQLADRHGARFAPHDGWSRL
ncbi:MAG: enoyl-CoA hydratase/isomerase family protein [Gammaproteobacteria bacterium]|nr:enoyl-CoA hydratase/isomerase family protein [Gammaproteobacteria bacterium]MBT8105101.1 enoyl-CoA hydratase/isomerase family protein [Gammaproteobacteria bacterium]NNF48659.1 3-hydroxyacyl-CoA dehydrogenase [Woeseiaceae bacterium]NNK25115.1 3-hydroxyacyl-CoA dehydrogenase [Woeseiaceae bacterium]NNL62320.1 3-hydroxyacyl-CoA dehydrogenase [Woeseiaceae bacterium]